MKKIIKKLFGKKEQSLPEIAVEQPYPMITESMQHEETPQQKADRERDERIKREEEARR